MPDPKARYEIKGKTYIENEDGSFAEVKAPVSINDGTAPNYKTTAPEIKMRIPAQDQILNTPEPEDITKTGGDSLGATPMMPLAGVTLDQMVPARRKATMQTTGALAAAMLTKNPSALGAIARSAGGTMLGNAAGQIVEGSDKGFSFGEMFQEGGTDAIINLLTGGAVGLAGQAIKYGKMAIPFAKNAASKGVKEAIFDSLLGGKHIISRDRAGVPVDVYNQETRAAIEAAPQIPMSVGMITGHTGPENSLTPDLAKKAHETATKANLETVKEFLPALDKEAAGKVGMERAGKLKEELRVVEDAKYEKVSKAAKSHVQDAVVGYQTKVIPPSKILDASGKPVTPGSTVKVPIVEKIEGPILIGEVNDYVNKGLKEVRKVLELTGNSSAISGELGVLEKTLSKFEGVQTIPYETARSVQASLNSTLNNPNKGLIPSNTRRILRNLKDNLDKDVINSMEMNWPQGSADIFKEALSSTAKRGSIITKGINKAYMAGQQVPEKFFDNAFTSATEARRMARVNGQEDTAKQYVGQFTDKYWDKAAGTLDGAAASREWLKDSNQEISKVLLGKEQRQSIEYFFRRQSAIEGSGSSQGVLSLGTQEANASIGTLRDLAGMKGNPMKLFTGGALLKLGAIVKGREFSEKVLLNPARAREAATLLGIDKARPEAPALARKFILGGKFGQIVLQSSDGQRVEGNPETGEWEKIK